MKKRLNENFLNLCDWFVDNKFTIHNLYLHNQQRGKNIHQLNIKYRDIDIKQHSEVTTYLGYVPDKTIPGEPMALKVINKINGKLKFFYRKIDL